MRLKIEANTDFTSTTKESSFGMSVEKLVRRSRTGEGIMEDVRQQEEGRRDEKKRGERRRESVCEQGWLTPRNVLHLNEVHMTSSFYMPLGDATMWFKVFRQKNKVTERKTNEEMKSPATKNKFLASTQNTSYYDYRRMMILVSSIVQHHAQVCIHFQAHHLFIMRSSRISPSRSPRKRRHPPSSSFSATCLVALGALGGVLMSWSFVPLERWLLLRESTKEIPPPPPPKKQKLLISEWDDQEPPQVLVDLLFDRSQAVKEKSLISQPTNEFMAAQTFVAPPTASQKTFFVAGWKEVHPMVRALRNLGWTRVNDPQDARLVYFYEEARNLRPNATQPWQRPSWTYQGLHWWDDAVVYDILHQQRPQGSPYFRETYNLESPSEFSIFLRQIRTDRDHFEGRAWIVKEPDLIHPHNGDFLNVSDGDGTHYTILPPHSSALQNFLDRPASFVGLINTTTTTNNTATRNDETAMNNATAITLEEEEVLPKSTFQRYVCQPLRWKDGRPFTIRVFWFVSPCTNNYR